MLYEYCSIIYSFYIEPQQKFYDKNLITHEFDILEQTTLKIFFKTTAYNNLDWKWSLFNGITVFKNIFQIKLESLKY